MDKRQMQKIKEIAYNFDDGYYHVSKDIADYPEAWCVIAWSMRGPGKTTGAMALMLAEGYKFLYMKRTKDDVELLCSGKAAGGLDTDDINPFSPLNRLAGTNIKPCMIDRKHAFAGFYECDDDGNPAGQPLGYILAFNGVKSFKGMNFDFCDYIIFDEFIPQIGERTSAGQKEGELVLQFYMTALRDRVQRGDKEIKLLLFANAEEVATPITRTLEVMDDIIELTYSEETRQYLEDRGILLHHIKASEVKAGNYQTTGIHKAMSGTAWGRKTFEGEFTGNDFSKVKKLNLAGFKPLAAYFYENKYVYIYINGVGTYYLTYSKQKVSDVYDLNVEGSAQAFYYDYVCDLRMAIMDGQLFCEKYTMYDLITNYKKYFKKF